MANNDILPFGPGGEMPSGVGIVNDLTTGGANKALSAEMGKKLNEDALYAEQILAAKNTVFPSGNKSWFGSNYGKAVNILHFSDIHGDAVNLARIVAFKNANPSLNAALFTGDMVWKNWGDGVSFWSSAGAGNIMVALGNHDTYSGNNWYAKTAAESYERYIEPFVSNWGVTSQEDLCYYYKDWSTEKVRLIVLDVQHWDSAQETWLIETLASARTASYHVICAGHCSPANSDTGIRTCPFDTLGANLSHWESASYGKMNSAAPAAVQNFIDAGGHFVCWLTGHTHADMFRHPKDYPHQLYVAVANAGDNIHVSSGASCVIYRADGEKSQDLFNIVGVNPIRETLTITRVGADRDTIGRHIGTVVYDYAANEIINCE